MLDFFICRVYNPCGSIKAQLACCIGVGLQDEVTMPTKQLDLVILNQPEWAQHITTFHCGKMDLLLTIGPLALPAGHQDRHGQYEFLVPLSGIPHFHVEGREINCQPGCIVPINPGQRHGLKSGHKAMTFISVFAESIWMEQMIHQLKGDAATGFPNEPLNLESNVQLLISQLVAENRKVAPCRDYFLHNLTEQLAVQLIRDYCRAPVPPESLTPDKLSGDQERFRAVIDLIHRDYCFPLSNERMAALAGLNHYHFIRSFKRAFAISPYSFVMSIRMVHARRLLGTTILPVAEVCRQCGFQSASRFASLFREENGLSPSAYRQATLPPEVAEEEARQSRMAGEQAKPENAAVAESRSGRAMRS
jgi:AraC-like DNA-binding protein